MTKTKLFSGLKTKILFATIIPVVLCFILVAAVFFNTVSSMSNEEGRAKLLQTSQIYASGFETKLSDALNYLTLLSSDLESLVQQGGFDREHLQQRILYVFDEYGLVDGSSIYFEQNMLDGLDAEYINTQYGTSLTGRVAWYYYKINGETSFLPEALPDESEFEMAHYTMAKEANRPIYTDPVSYEVDGEQLHMFTITYPIHDENKNFIGAVTVDVFLDDIYNQLQNEKIYETGYVGIFNDRDGVIYSPNYDYIGLTRAELGLDEPLSQFADSYGFYYSPSVTTGADSLVVFNPLYSPQLDATFYVSVAAPLDEIFAEGKTMTTLLLLFFVAVIAAIALVVYFMVRRLSSPLDEITYSVNKFAAGDYSTRIEGAFKDEFAVVKESVNTMADSIEIYITEQQKALEQAEQANRAKSEFLSRMTHEMRTPMGAIIGMTSIAKSSDDAEQKEHCLDRIDSASRHLLGIINDILDLSKIEADKFELSFMDFGVEQLWKKIRDVAGFRAEEKHQTLTLALDESIPPYLHSDEQRLSQVITNLLSNAIKFSPEHGVIKCEARVLSVVEGVYTIQIDISDSGIGISEEQKERLFSSFEQADGSISRKYGGTGLGLAISKRIVELLGGEIWLESELGKGSTFSFTFKAEEARSLASEDTADSSEAAAGDDLPANFEGKTVLLAEDIAINREIFLALLEDTRLTIACAENGQEALDTFAANPGAYDLIFMDLQMPELDGLEATRRIRALGTQEAEDIPIIALTANVFKEDIEKCLEAGMNDHLGKPIDLDEVIRKLRLYL